MSTQVTKSKSANTQVSAPISSDFLAELQAEAKALAAAERPAISNISFRAGMVSLNGEPVKGNSIRGVIVGAAFVNTLYTAKYDPDNAQNPECAAVSANGDNMSPQGNVENPPSAACATCPNAQWGSDIRDGKPAKGKRCKESRRLVFLPEDCLESPEEIAKAELAQCKLPVTSVKAWGGFVNTLAASVNMPYYAVVAEITTKPDLKTQFKVVITPVAAIQDEATLRAIIAKREEAMRIALLPVDVGNEAAADESAAPAANAKF